MVFRKRKYENRKEKVSTSVNLIYLFIIIALLGFIFFALNSCASTMLTDSWKSKEYPEFKPKNIMIVGVTQNTTARMIYEEQLKNEIILRGLKASQSSLIFEKSFKDSKQTEEEIDKQIDRLVDLGYDAILISAVKGVDEKVSYSEGIPQSYFYLRRFGRHYYLYQDIYFEPGYYNRYKVYQIETTLYNINENTDKSLVWVGSYNIINPENITKTVNSYVKAVVRSLEQENLIPKTVQ
jgi:hypothetical protein